MIDVEKGKDTNITIELEQEKAMNRMLSDLNEESAKESKRKSKIVVLLIMCMFLEAVIGFGAFVWYESQFESTTVETETIDLDTQGDNANINHVEGSQYNDSATHNE